MTDYTLYMLITVPESSLTNGILSFTFLDPPGEDIDWQLVFSVICLSVVAILFVTCVCFLVIYSKSGPEAA